MPTPGSPTPLTQCRATWLAHPSLPGPPMASLLMAGVSTGLRRNKGLNHLNATAFKWPKHPLGPLTDSSTCLPKHLQLKPVYVSVGLCNVGLFCIHLCFFRVGLDAPCSNCCVSKADTEPALSTLMT